MSKSRKKRLRQKFREAVFRRDGYRCVMCGFLSSPKRAEHDLDAHHITPREQMPHGGYVLENGITLCDPEKSGGKAVDGCHFRAEDRLKTEQAWEELGQPLNHLEGLFKEFSPSELYEKVGSSYKQALEACEYLK